MTKTTFQRIMNTRIQNGKSRTYPDRKDYVVVSEDYLLHNRSCTVYIKRTGEIVDLKPDIFQILLQDIWRIQKRDQSHCYRIKSLYEPYNENNTIPLLEKIPDHSIVTPVQYVLQENSRNQVRKMVAQLPSVQREVMEGLFFKDLTVTEIAKLLECSQSTIHYVKKKALEQMRTLLMEEGIDADSLYEENEFDR